MSRIETVKIVNKDSKNGWSIINKNEFNDKEHVLYENKTKKKEEKVVKPIKKKQPKKSK